MTPEMLEHWSEAITQLRNEILCDADTAGVTIEATVLLSMSLNALDNARQLLDLACYRQRQALAGER